MAIKPGQRPNRPVGRTPPGPSEKSGPKRGTRSDFSSPSADRGGRMKWGQRRAFKGYVRETFGYVEKGAKALGKEFWKAATIKPKEMRKMEKANLPQKRGGVLDTLLGVGAASKGEVKTTKKTVMGELFGGKKSLTKNELKWNISKKVQDFNIPGFSDRKMYKKQRGQFGDYLLEEYKKMYGSSEVIMEDKLNRLLVKKRKDIMSSYYKPSMEKFKKERGREPTQSDVLREMYAKRKEFKAHRAWLEKEIKEKNK